MIENLIEIILFQAGYNVSLVLFGATILGFVAGMAGVFIFLQKRALVCDALAHATLPGIAIAFLVMTFLGGTGRSLIGLLFGAALTAALGLYCIDLINRYTRLSEDVAIGAILSVFFGAGVVLLTYIQTLSFGGVAGLESFLFGAVAGMLLEDAYILVIGSGFCLMILLLLQRPLTLISFDRVYAHSLRLNIRFYDLSLMMLIMGITVIGLKIAGLILIVALLIIPTVAARFWSDNIGFILWASAIIGGLSGFMGAALSALLPDMPTGPIIVLICFIFFLLSFLFAPFRGVLAQFMKQRQFQEKVHRRQGLLALGHNEKIYDGLTLKILSREGYLRKDGMATPLGQSAAGKALLEEKRWQIFRQMSVHNSNVKGFDELEDIANFLTSDELNQIDIIIDKQNRVI